jgi:hypothetical protein
MTRKSNIAKPWWKGSRLHKEGAGEGGWGECLEEEEGGHLPLQERGDHQGYGGPIVRHESRVLQGCSGLKEVVLQGCSKAYRSNFIFIFCFLCVIIFCEQMMYLWLYLCLCLWIFMCMSLYELFWCVCDFEYKPEIMASERSINNSSTVKTAADTHVQGAELLL